jgi:hypothetical protein
VHRRNEAVRIPRLVAEPTWPVWSGALPQCTPTLIGTDRFTSPHKRYRRKAMQSKARQSKAKQSKAVQTVPHLRGRFNPFASWAVPLDVLSFHMVR